jgi:hypothetical protein
MLGTHKAGEPEVRLVVTLDRLTRSLLAHLEQRSLAGREVALHQAPRSRSTRAAPQVSACIGEWVRAAIAEPTATAMQHKPEGGEYTRGQAPYGSRVAPGGARLEPHSDEEESRTVARDLRAHGLSLRGVAAELERRGAEPDRQGVAPVQVVRMVA